MLARFPLHIDSFELPPIRPAGPKHNVLHLCWGQRELGLLSDELQSILRQHQKPYIPVVVPNAVKSRISFRRKSNQHVSFFPHRQTIFGETPQQAHFSLCLPRRSEPHSKRNRKGRRKHHARPIRGRCSPSVEPAQIYCLRHRNQRKHLERQKPPSSQLSRHSFLCERANSVGVTGHW